MHMKKMQNVITDWTLHTLCGVKTILSNFFSFETNTRPNPNETGNNIRM